MKESQFLFIVLESGALLIGAFSIPMWRRKIKPNGLYGFRTRLTLENPRIWYEVNASSGRNMFCFMLVMAPAAAALLFIKTKTAASAFMTVYAVIIGAGMLIITIKGVGLARKLYNQGWGETKPGS
jgi:hypothetical protein